MVSIRYAPYLCLSKVHKMTEISTYLFVYGTLLDTQNEFGAIISKHCVFYAEGKFKGTLYDIGEYPGAIPSTKANQFVYGKVFRLSETKVFMARLDDYEGLGPGQPQPTEFTRELVTIETNRETVLCWAYLYNLPVDGFKIISSGKYLG
jgi:gamma-glutamylcyclotransferase (GGCT)/AIG2-like uncharacterized protein YtfP